MQENTFEIGLVMAGAVSAGAYTAGVMDFLLQALKEWDTAKKNGINKAPPHNVQIKVLAGASAGGMTAAIFAAMINEEFSSITSIPGREPNPDEINNNKLYKAWVEQIDIASLLKGKDLKDPKGKVTSLLDSTILEEIAEKSLQFDSNDQRPAYIAEQLHLYLTLTNLQGVPYDIAFKGRSGKGHSISQHTDFFHFLLSDKKPKSQETEWLNSGNDNHRNWNLLKDVALATGAFPGGLAPRIINRSFSHYDLRAWPVPQRADPDHPSALRKCLKMESIKPSWPAHNQKQFNFLSVDGGVMDNEPLELARRALAGKQQFNPRRGKHAHRSIIMVDPFPSKKKTDLKTSRDLKEHDIVTVFLQLFGGLLSQSRFKPDELILANSDDVHSRYLIAPTRHINDDTKAKYPIASGFLNGFGGFFSKKFRMHDFQLGRRNCQQFLRRYFTLPVDQAKQNSIFASYSESDFERFSFQKDGTLHLPIIPLLGDARQEAFPLRWDVLKMQDAELNNLRNQINERTKAVLSRLIDQYIEGGITRTAAKIMARFKQNNIVDKIMKIIKNDLEDFNLKS